MAKFGYQQSWQYIVENASESPPTSVQYRLPGTIAGETPVEVRFNNKQIRGLKQPTETDMRRMDIIQGSKNEYTWSVTYVPMKRSNTPRYDFRHFHGLALNAASATTVAGAQTYGTNLTTALRTFAIFKETDTIQLQALGCIVDRLTVKASVDSPVEISAEGHASSATFADLVRTDATSLRDGTPFMWQDVQVYIDSALATFCTAFEYTINNAAQPDHVLGDRDPKAVRIGGRDIEVAITRQFNDTAQYADAKNSTAKRVTIRLDDATDVDVVFTDCKYEVFPVPGASDAKEILTHILRFKAETMFTT